MTNKKTKRQNEDRIEFDFFENYNNRVEVVGFRNSWVSEFNESMKEAYETKPEQEEKEEKDISV